MKKNIIFIFIFILSDCFCSEKESDNEKIKNYIELNCFNYELLRKHPLNDINSNEDAYEYWYLTGKIDACNEILIYLKLIIPH